MSWTWVAKLGELADQLVGPALRAALGEVVDAQVGKRQIVREDVEHGDDDGVGHRFVGLQPARVYP